MKDVEVVEIRGMEDFEIIFENVRYIQGRKNGIYRVKGTVKDRPFLVGNYSMDVSGINDEIMTGIIHKYGLGLSYFIGDKEGENFKVHASSPPDIFKHYNRKGNPSVWNISLDRGDIKDFARIFDLQRQKASKEMYLRVVPEGFSFDLDTFPEYVGGSRVLYMYYPENRIVGAVTSDNEINALHAQYIEKNGEKYISGTEDLVKAKEIRNQKYDLVVVFISE